MLDRLRSLVPFMQRESKIQVEDPKLRMVKKAMELVLAGGFHCQDHRLDGNPNFVYGEWFKVFSRNGSDRFIVYLNRDLFQYADTINQYSCRVYHKDAEGSNNAFWLEFGATDELSFRLPRNLGRKQSEAILNSYLESEVDKEATEADNKRSRELIYRKSIKDGTVIITWAKDMPDLSIAGFLNQR